MSAQNTRLTILLLAFFLVAIDEVLRLARGILDVVDAQAFHPPLHHR